MRAEVVEVYDVPGEPNEKSEYSRGGPPYLVSPSIPQEEVQGLSSAHEVLSLHHVYSILSEILMRPAHRSVCNVSLISPL